MTSLATQLFDIELRNPIVGAAGTCGYVGEMAEVTNLRHLGAVVTKSITVEQREGNPPQRVIGVSRGMMNAVGLANVGVNRFLSEKLPGAERLDTVLIGSIAGASIDDYVTIAAKFDPFAVMPMVELNVSCPNTDDGLLFGENAQALRDLVTAVRPALTHTKMIVKLSPNVGDITVMAQAAIESGADALTLTNTMPALAIDVETRQPRLSRGIGGLSGPAIHPIALRMVHEVYHGIARDAGIPIIGLGGVMNWQDAAEFILAGTTAVGMGTALMADPQSPRKVVKGLKKWVNRQGCASIKELIGQVSDPS